MSESEEEHDLFEEEGKEVEQTKDNKEEKHEEPIGKENANNELKILIDEVTITVSDPERKTKSSGLKIQETYVSYLIEVVPRSSESSVELAAAWRRYSEFELLRNYLVAVYPAVVVAPMPEKRANYIWRKLASVEAIDLDFLERRRSALETFLLRVASHPQMGRDHMLRWFVKREEGWKEAVMATGFQAKSDSWLKSMNASLRVKSPDMRLEQLRYYAGHLQSATSNLLKMRAKVAERIYGIYKLHGNYSRVMREWALVESSASMKESLQAASIQMDAYAKSIDDLIDEDDQLAEQIKEYMYFADSLKMVCSKHQAAQYEVEQCEHQLANALSEQKQLEQQQKESTASGGASSGGGMKFSFNSMKARLLGIDPAVQREGRLEQLEIDIGIFEGELEKSRERAADFLSDALTETERFQKRKMTDLREIFTGYAVLQIKLHQSSLGLWKKFQKPLQGVVQSQIQQITG